MKSITFLLLITTLNFSAVFLAHSAENFAFPVAMTTSPGGTGYVEATLAGSVTASFLIDTGSSMLVINQNTFNALKRNSHVSFSHEAAARLANGKLHRVDVYTVHQFRIGKHCDLGKVEIAVIKKGNNILGMSALKKAAPFAVSINPPTLMLSECTQELTVAVP